MKICSKAAKHHAISSYEIPEELKTPREIYSKENVKKLLEDAIYVVRTCQKIITMITKRK